jgi:glycosyltransferase involved in cell wall biosynthesis
MHRFIVPDLDGPISGGTLFNRMLIEALVASGWPANLLPLARAAAVLTKASTPDVFWVDTLYLAELPALVRAARGVVPVLLIAHYLPTLVARGNQLKRSDLTEAETAGLRNADGFLVPSAFMRGIVERVAGADRPILQIEPGRLAHAPVEAPGPPARAVMVANLVPGKGVEPFLRDLAEQLEESDPFRLTIIGGSVHDPAYAQRCRELGNARPLAGRVSFEGALSPAMTVLRMAASNLFISASVMESYGMALAEAKALGLPIIATRGGNVAALVARQSGGELASCSMKLAAACLALCRDPDEHRLRIERARAHALPDRPWAFAARDFIAASTTLGKSTRRRHARDEVSREHD